MSKTGKYRQKSQEANSHLKELCEEVSTYYIYPEKSTNA